ncbi:MAG: undecaprenyl-phosphate alpha-N-acetylglucosaminyl 1-phosphate transferase [Candidatus Hydrogenedentota bacterium]
MTDWQVNWYSIFAYALGISFLASAIFTHIVRLLAIRWGIYDHPGERKMQVEPVPLLGGVAIVVTFYGVIAFNLLMLIPVQQFGFTWLADHVLHFLGKGQDVVWKLGGLAVGGLIVFALGVVDDLKTLGPEKKLVGQVAASLVLVLSGVRLDLFNDIVPQPLATIFGSLAAMFWVIMMMNAMNFLDNMDGLSAGISLIAALSFFACFLPSGQTFVCVLLLVFAGSVAGFLYHNFNPARIYMGDAGSMFCGYILATVALLGTFYTADATPSRVALAAPFLALSVPIFDTSSVVFIRWRRGESIMKGDKRHFSHRLVEIGMSPRQAVEFIYLVGFVSGLGAVLLPHVSTMGTMLVVAQTIGLYSLIVLLMIPANGRRKAP